MVADFTIEDLSEGQSFSFEKVVTEADVKAFTILSGDVNPLHIDDEFAKKRGFRGQVVQGLLLASYFSRLVGVHLPGRNALLHSVNVRFIEPVYLNDKLKISAVIEQISTSANVIILSVVIENLSSGRISTKGKIQVGFTKELT